MRTLADNFERSCFRKVAHPDKQTAQEQADRMARLERAAFTVYHCFCCGNWHVAHKRKEEK